MVMLRLKSKIKDTNSQKYKMLSKDIVDFDNCLLDLNQYKEIPWQFLLVKYLKGFFGREILINVVYLMSTSESSLI